MRHRSALALLAWVALGPISARATTMAIDFCVASTLERPVVGSGTVITDSSHLDPNDDTTDPSTSSR